ncbi:discoidin domain-containing protein [Streptomyces cocklensis]|uniref:Alpha-L-fucosidase n=1 Tax=Actinacidiphila cocklensis TaxID=887465 RepID=A0A9W4DQF6_9ACTN|nr:discoidin domain-containing protein [Actinacidiphila cocklensis]MDD1062652.1 discoidin domain-containing protein [Actinacidiphila cocklensis]WSX75468.1 discoidin domain-containing protein [Streptomyces sp. NBC_00899]CAG6392138.1 Alpha-L-fucosidase [Actinacidiphila cocklensis]
MSRRVLARWLAVLSMLLGSALLLPGPAARADLTNPRQDFLRASTGGLFLHWGERTSPQHTSCSQWETDVTNGGWTPDYWVTEAQKLHVQYLVLATFHSRLGYARPWPSAIPGSCHTQRDFLGELINAASAKGLKVILYMTDDPQWHDDGGHEWLDSAAFSSYAGHSVDLTTRDGFGEFSYDNFFEVMNRYPNLGGFWIDNDNQYWLDHNLYQQIYQQRPNYTISNNNEDTLIMDMISNEQKTGMTPSYDYPQALYTAQPRLTEADFKLPSTGAWWYDGTDPTVDKLLTLGRLITNAGSSVKALMAETAQVSGKFPANQEVFNNFANTYLSQIWPSIHDTEGGGYMYGGLKPGFWNDGAHGVTTISKTDPDLQYIHVVTPPTTSTLKIRDNGYRVSSVTNLRTGAAIPFTQSGGTLTLTGLGSWDPYDTVFTVVTNGRTGIYPPSSYTVTASASASGHAASAAADGSYLAYWDNNKTLPVTVTYDLGSAKTVKYIGLNQREDSVSYARSSTETSARINAYKVLESGDGSSWTTVKTGTLPDRRGVAFIDVPSASTRYVRLEVDSTYAASTDTTRYKRLRLDESWLGAAYATAATRAAPARYEAEDAAYSAGSTVDANHLNYSGSGFVNTDNAVGGYVEWTVNAAAARSVPVTVRYANGTTADRPADVIVNGTTVAAAHSFGGTGSWDTWADATVTVPLNAGANTIRVAAATVNGDPNLDYLEVPQ